MGITFIIGTAFGARGRKKEVKFLVDTWGYSRQSENRVERKLSAIILDTESGGANP